MLCKFFCFVMQLSIRTCFILSLLFDVFFPCFRPPYSKEDLSDVTVCFADTRRCPFSESDAKLLRSLFIPVCPPVLLSNYLTDKVAPVPAEHCLPDFKV